MRASFEDFFRALNHDQDGNPLSPYPWQRRLSRDIAAGNWPEALRIPTGLGKTALIDIWVYNLAAEIQQSPRRRNIPIRLAWVSNRRIIVDQVYRRACHIADALANPEHPALREVADILRTVGECPLDCIELRGGLNTESRKIVSPVQPTLISATVDQVGSRLLFRSYGAAKSRRHVESGLLAFDTLLALDEAQGSRAFLETARAIASRVRDAEHPMPNPMRLMVVTATPPPEAKRVFDLDAADLACPEVVRRLNAEKTVTLVKLKQPKEATKQDAGEMIAMALAEHAERLVDEGLQCVAVVANEVAIAKQAWRILAQRKRRTMLLIGAMRPVDRAAIENSSDFKSVFTGAKRSFSEPLFVVATQTIEAGADLDFDGMVIQAASIDATIQRFGRVNRGARNIESRGVIVYLDTQSHLYGNSVKKTWEWLRRKAGDGIDMSTGAIIKSLSNIPDAELSEMLTPYRPPPPLIPAYIDALCETHPGQDVCPDVEMFLHGDCGDPEAYVVWRDDLPPLTAANLKACARTVALCPPVSEEAMPVHLGRLSQWIKNGNRALLWRGEEDSCIIAGEEHQIRSGDTLIVPVGPNDDWNWLGHKPESQPADVAEIARWTYLSQACLRIHPARLNTLPKCDGRKVLSDLLDENDFDREIIRDAIADLSTRADEPVRSLLSRLAVAPWVLEIYPPEAGVGCVIRESAAVPEQTYWRDELQGAGSGRVYLRAHSAGVARTVAQFARLCGLSDAHRRVLLLSAMFHDHGKADPQFQEWLRLSDGIYDPSSADLLAKSSQVSQEVRESCRVKSGYPRGARHELLSAALFLSAAQRFSRLDRDLAAHLIASHHGYCRPFAKSVRERRDGQVSVNLFGLNVSSPVRHGLEELGSGVAERFWLLVRRYGWWGLAYLETMLVLADHLQSRKEVSQ